MVAVGGSAGGRGVQLVSPNYTHMHTTYETTYRPRGDDMPPPRRRQFDLWRIYIRQWTGPQSANVWWPAVAKLQPLYRGRQPVCL